ncbi:MAG: hypothetical protein U0R78_15470 [Nocardioidaceae bacterium]
MKSTGGLNAELRRRLLVAGDDEVHLADVDAVLDTVRDREPPALLDDDDLGALDDGAVPSWQR